MKYINTISQLNVAASLVMHDVHVCIRAADRGNKPHTAYVAVSCKVLCARIHDRIKYLRNAS